MSNDTDIGYANKPETQISSAVGRIRSKTMRLQELTESVASLCDRLAGTVPAAGGAEVHTNPDSPCDAAALQSLGNAISAFENAIEAHENAVLRLNDIGIA